VTDKIAIIGFGNIASAIITPLLDNKLIQPENVFCVVNTEKSLEKIKKKRLMIKKINNRIKYHIQKIYAKSMLLKVAT